jgi:hypothetical protein
MLIRPNDHNAAGRIGSAAKSNDLIENESQGLQACITDITYTKQELDISKLFNICFRVYINVNCIEILKQTRVYAG